MSTGVFTTRNIRWRLVATIASVIYVLFLTALNPEAFGYYALGVLCLIVGVVLIWIRDREKLAAVAFLIAGIAILFGFLSIANIYYGYINPIGFIGLILLSLIPIISAILSGRNLSEPHNNSSLASSVQQATAPLRENSSISSSSPGIQERHATPNPVTSPASTTVTATRASNSVEDRLQQIEALKAKGMITEVEYQQRRERILDEI